MLDLVTNRFMAGEMEAVAFLTSLHEIKIVLISEITKITLQKRSSQTHSPFNNLFHVFYLISTSLVIISPDKKLTNSISYFLKLS